MSADKEEKLLLFFDWANVLKEKKEKENEIWNLSSSLQLRLWATNKLRNADQISSNSTRRPKLRYLDSLDGQLKVN